ncbi:MAG: DUF1697 domain-containing protein [Myxococcales bacterium]
MVARPARRYVAFLRGVSPLNAKMPELKRAFERAGFEDVETMLTSGNVLFSARGGSERAIAQRAEAAMAQHLGRSFVTFIRSVDELRHLLQTSPYAAHRPRPRPRSKRVVTFLHSSPKHPPSLPLELPGVRILCIAGREVFSDYAAETRGPALMQLLQKTFGKSNTTRTWQTVEKAAADVKATAKANGRPTVNARAKVKAKTKATAK